MASFALINSSNIVLEVHSLNDKWLLDSENNVSEAKGIKRLEVIHGDAAPNYWKQTFRDASSRKNFAGIGFTYDSGRDAFIPPQDHPSWSLNETTCRWEAPTADPKSSDYTYVWNEDNSRWEGWKHSEIAAGTAPNEYNYYWTGSAWQSM